MKIINYKQVMPTAIHNGTIKNVAGRVMIGKEDDAPHFCMRVLEMKEGGFTPKHAHDWEHEIFIHAGKGDVFIEDKWHAVSSGTAIFIPANVEHQFRYTSGNFFTFVCLVPKGAPEL
mgnify:FL=1|jgi:quercetin dioxygenase-like cupin family protein